MACKIFEGILDRHFEARLRDNPIYATMFGGLKEAEGKLGSQSLAFHQRREKERLATLARLDTISPGGLSADQHIDRLALRSLLLKESEDYARGRHTMEPAAPAMLMEILLHELMRADDQPERGAANLRKLLKQVPDFLAEGSASVVSPDPLWIQVMDQVVGGMPSLLAPIGALLARVSARQTDRDLVSAAGKAVERYRDAVHNRALAPSGSFAVGRFAMERRLRDELGLDYTLGQVERLAEQEVIRVGELLVKECARIDKNLSPEEITTRAREDWNPPVPMLDYYRKETARVARAFRDAKVVTFPESQELRLKEVPDFLRPIIATAAYNPPGAFDKRQLGIFWVKEPRGQTPEAQIMEARQHFGLELTCAHEAFPGHHLQFVRANQHPRKWRRLFAHAVFYEGWTLWCEQMAVDLRIVTDPALRVQQLHDALWRCHRILIDLRLQTGRYTPEQAAAHLRKHLGFSRERSESEVNWYSSQPAVPMSYWLGRLEVNRLRARLVDGAGWSLRKFNDWLLSHGTVPQAWIEKYALEG